MANFVLPGPAIMENVIANRLMIAQHATSVLTMKSIRCFRIPEDVKYFPFCDDFGPMNMLSIFRFIRGLDNELSQSDSKKLVLYVKDGKPVKVLYFKDL